jgi:SAM-dependent methyltransferase
MFGGATAVRHDVAMSMREAWDNVAERWTAWARTPGHDSFELFHGERFFELLPPPRGLTVDIGAGEGRVARALRPRGYSVVEIEGSTGLAHANAAHGGVVANADAARLPLRGRVADLAIAFMSMQDIDDMPAAIMEAARVLVPGGHLALAIVHPMNSAGAFDPAAEGEIDSERPFVVRGSYLAEYRYADDAGRDELTMHFESAHRPLEAYSSALEDAGFAIEALREVSEPNPTDKWYRIPLFLDLRAVRT